MRKKLEQSGSHSNGRGIIHSARDNLMKSGGLNKFSTSVWLCFILFVSGFTLVPVSATAQPQEVRSEFTLKELLEKAITTFVAGDYENARTLFDDLENVFGKEPEFNAPELQKILLPIRGYLALFDDDPSAAIEFLERFLKAFPGEEKKMPLVLFSLIQSYRKTGEFEKAVEYSDKFINAYPEKPEAALIVLQQAEILFENDEYERGLNVLEAFYKSGSALNLRTEGRLRALKESMEHEDFETASRILLETQWQVSHMPELAVLVFSALQLGDHSLDMDRPAEAIRCYRLVEPMPVLIRAQEMRLQQIQKDLSRYQTDGNDSVNRIWVEYYKSLASRLQALLEQLRQSEDYSGPFYLRFGQAYFDEERYREASIIFSTLAGNDEFSVEVQEDAHYRWILAEQAMEKWSESISLANRFLEEYPESGKIPAIYWTIAQAKQELQYYDEAIELLTFLMNGYPDNARFPRWLFTRGFCRLLAEYNSDARKDFARYQQRWPDGILVINARLWHALGWFFDKDYDPALKELDELLKVAGDHHLKPEIIYRRASVLYARKEYDQALKQIDDYLEAYPGHLRIPEANVLRGDILMGQGELMGAALAFKKVTPEAGHLFPYAVFQSGKIFKAREDYTRMVDHFKTYVERDDLAFKPRISEALYWMGWAYEQLDEMDKAFPVFINALETYGNDPKIQEMQMIFQALHRFYGKIQSSSTLLAQTDHTLALAPSFEDWLNQERESALIRKYLTYYSRLSLYAANLHRKNKNPEAADLVMFEVINNVPVELLDDEGLAAAGKTLMDAGYPSANQYFTAILERFPNSIQRAVAWYGLAKSYFDNEQYEASRMLTWRIIQELPTHTIGPDAYLLHASSQIRTGQAAEAIPLLESLLRLKFARGLPHARALLGIGQAYESLDNPEKATAYYQRVYTLYRAYAAPLATAYYRGALLFEKLDNPTAAVNTLQEMLKEDNLRNTPEYDQASQYLADLLEKYPSTNQTDSEPMESSPEAPATTEPNP